MSVKAFCYKKTKIGLKFQISLRAEVEVDQWADSQMLSII